MKHVFVSPHMDDAVLSAGDYILELKRKGQKVFVVTVFTEFGKEPISLRNRKYLYNSGFLNLRRFSNQRKEEDKEAMKKLGVEYFHLGIIDGTFRKREDASLLANALAYLGIGKKFIYPTRKALFSGKISPLDKPLLQKIYLKLKERTNKSGILYCPLGIGNHADHLIIREVVSCFPNQKYYWLDQPYISWKGRQKQLELLQNKFRKSFVVEKNPQKKEVVKCYSSQVNGLFPDGIKFKKEAFYEERN